MAKCSWAWKFHGMRCCHRKNEIIPCTLVVLLMTAIGAKYQSNIEDRLHIKLMDWDRFFGWSLNIHRKGLVDSPRFIPMCTALSSLVHPAKTITMMQVSNPNMQDSSLPLLRYSVVGSELRRSMSSHDPYLCWMPMDEGI